MYCGYRNKCTTARMRPDYFHKIKFVSMNAKIIEENSELSFSVMFIFRDVTLYAMRCRNISKRKMIMGG